MRGGEERGRKEGTGRGGERGRGKEHLQSTTPAVVPEESWTNPKHKRKDRVFITFSKWQEVLYHMI